MVQARTIDVVCGSRALACILAALGTLLVPRAEAAIHVIPPGQEVLAASMLGRDEPSLPGDCRFAGAVIRQTRVAATYACGSARGEVVIELRHPDEGGGVVRTEQFVLAPVAGTPPAALLNALAERIRRSEEQWKWDKTGDEAAPPPAARALEHTGVPAGSHWLLPVTCLLIAVAWARARPSVARVDLELAALLGVGALGLRLTLGPWGPLRINGLGPMWLDGAISDPGQLYGYGPGYPELFSVIARLAPTAPDMAIFAANGVLSALVPVLAFILARRVGLDPARATLAGALLALDPVMLRVATTESYLPGIITLTLLGTITLVDAALNVLRRDWKQAALLVAAAGLALSQSVRIHPVAWIPAALAPLAVLAVDETVRWPRRLLLATTAAAMTGAIITLTSGGLVLVQLGLVQHGEVMTPSSPSLTWQLPVVAIALACLAFQWARPRWLIVPALAQLGALIATRHNFGQSWLWQQSYDRLYLALPTLAVAAFVHESWLGSWVVRSAAAVAGVLLVFFSGPFLRQRTTDHLEYRWMREAIVPLPRECLIVYVGQEGLRSMVLPIFGSPARPAREAVRLDPTNWADLAHLLHGSPCTYYVHTSLCSSTDARRACERVESLLDLEPIAGNSFPAVPSNSGLPYDRPEVESVIYRVLNQHAAWQPERRRQLGDRLP